MILESNGLPFGRNKFITRSIMMNKKCISAVVWKWQATRQQVIIEQIVNKSKRHTRSNVTRSKLP